MVGREPVEYEPTATGGEPELCLLLQARRGTQVHRVKPGSHMAELATRPVWRSRTVKYRSTAMTAVVAISASLVLLVTTVSPASAHLSENLFYGRVAYGNPWTTCAGQYVTQNHGDPWFERFGRYVSTTAYRQLGASGAQGCDSTRVEQPISWIQHRGVVYKDGGLCVVGGWDWNRSISDNLVWYTYERGSTLCGGTGWITHDVTSAVYIGSPYNYFAIGSKYPFPTTGHSYLF